MTAVTLRCNGSYPEGRYEFLVIAMAQKYLRTLSTLHIAAPFSMPTTPQILMRKILFSVDANDL